MSQEPSSAPGDRVVARLFGVLLMVAGVLFMSMGGLCGAAMTLGAVFALLTNPGVLVRGSTYINSAGMLIFNVVLPLAVGYAFFHFGRKLAPPRPKPGPARVAEPPSAGD